MATDIDKSMAVPCEIIQSTHLFLLTQTHTHRDAAMHDNNSPEHFQYLSELRTASASKKKKGKSVGWMCWRPPVCSTTHTTRRKPTKSTTATTTRGGQAVTRTGGGVGRGRGVRSAAFPWPPPYHHISSSSSACLLLPLPSIPLPSHSHACTPCLAPSLPACTHPLPTEPAS